MDKYDRAIKYLTKFPEKIDRAWSAPHSATELQVERAHCLFQYVTPNGKIMDNKGDPYGCGCLTEIRSGLNEGFTPELTKEKREDERISANIDNVEPSDLPVFAEWQRRLDKELSRA